MPRLFSSFLKKKKKKQHIDVFQVLISITNTSTRLVFRPVKKQIRIKNLLVDLRARH